MNVTNASGNGDLLEQRPQWVKKPTEGTEPNVYGKEEKEPEWTLNWLNKIKAAMN